MPLPTGLRRRQLGRLAAIIAADPRLAGLFYKTVLYPANVPDNNPAFLPTLALYCTHESNSFATTNQHRRPGGFTALLMFPEPQDETGMTYETIYQNLLDTSDALIEVLQTNITDKIAPQLWHKLLFGGDAKNSGGFPVGQFTAQYARNPQKMQVAIITFMLASNLRNA